MAKGFASIDLSQRKTCKYSSVRANVNCEQIQKQLASHFKDLEDLRGSLGVLHPFLSIVMIALLATIGGAARWEELEIYGVSHESWLSSFLALLKAIPSADTYRLFLPENASLAV